MKRVLAVAALVGLSCVGRSASGALLTYEGFDYANTTEIGPTAGGNGQTGGSGWSTSTSAGVPNGTWQTSASPNAAPKATSPGLSYTDSLGNQLQVTGNKATYGGTTSHSGVIRSLANTFNGADGSMTGKTIWVSYLSEYHGAVPGSPVDSRYLYMSLYNGNSSVVNVGKWNNTGTTNGTSNTALWSLNGNGTTNVSDDVISQNVTALLVLKIDFTSTTTANLSLFVNPTIGGADPVTADVSQTRNTALTFNAIRIQGNGNGSWDELRVGESFADVTPFVAVPEPTTVGLLGGAGLLSLARRRRENRT